MREIKFRGKIISGEWVFGNLTILKTKYQNIDSGYYISNSAGLPFAYKIIPETMGQYTGVKDKNGVEIYEGDIVKLCRSYGYGWLSKGTVAQVKWDNNELCYFLFNNFRLTKNKKVEIIGNIYENPELLEVKNES